MASDKRRGVQRTARQLRPSKIPLYEVMLLFAAASRTTTPSPSAALVHLSSPGVGAHVADQISVEGEVCTVRVRATLVLFYDLIMPIEML